MHSLRRIWHWVRSQNKTLFSTRFLFQWQFFSSYLNSSCSMIFEKLIIFQIHDFSICQNRESLADHTQLSRKNSSFMKLFFQTSYLPLKNRRDRRDFLSHRPWFINEGKLCVPAFQGGLRNIQTTDFQFVSRKWWKPLLWDFLSFWGSRDEKAVPVLFVFEEGLQGRRSSPFWRSNEFHKEDFLLQGKEAQRVKNPDVSFPAIRRLLLHIGAKGIRLLFHWVIGEKDYPVQTRSPDWGIPDVF